MRWIRKLLWKWRVWRIRRRPYRPALSSTALWNILKEEFPPRSLEKLAERPHPILKAPRGAGDITRRGW